MDTKYYPILATPLSIILLSIIYWEYFFINNLHSQYQWEVCHANAIPLANECLIILLIIDALDNSSLWILLSYLQQDIS